MHPGSISQVWLETAVRGPGSGIRRTGSSAAGWVLALGTGRDIINESPRHDPTRIDQRLSQYGSMALRLVGAITPDGKVRMGRKRCEQCEETRGRRRAHLLLVFPSKALPSGLGQRLRRYPRQQRSARGEVREPDVVVIATRKFGTRNTSGRTTNRSQPEPLVWMTRRTEANDSNRHVRPERALTRDRSAARSRGSCTQPSDRSLVAQSSLDRRRASPERPPCRTPHAAAGSGSE